MDRRLYARYRMSISLNRLVAATTPEAKRQAVQWARAWAVASGSAVLRLRQRSVAAPPRQVHRSRTPFHALRNLLFIAEMCVIRYLLSLAARRLRQFDKTDAYQNSCSAFGGVLIIYLTGQILHCSKQA